ncbi:MAG: hypothetical protein ACRD3E_14600 [Terriglobales bacterium]
MIDVFLSIIIFLFGIMMIIIMFVRKFLLILNTGTLINPREPIDQLARAQSLKPALPFIASPCAVSNNESIPGRAGRGPVCL